MKVKVFNLTLGGSLPAYAPKRVISLTAVAGGLAFAPPEIGTVAYRDLVGLMVLQPPEMGGTIPALLFFVRDRPRPLLVAPVAIQKSGFPDIQAPTLIERLRAQALFICRQPGQLMADRETAEFLQGKPLADRGKTTEQLANAMARTLAATGLIPDMSQSGRAPAAVPTPATHPSATAPAATSSSMPVSTAPTPGPTAPTPGPTSSDPASRWTQAPPPPPPSAGPAVPAPQPAPVAPTPQPAPAARVFRDDPSPPQGDVYGGDVYGGEIDSGSGAAGGVPAGSVQGGDVYAGDVYAGDVHAGDVYAGDVYAGGSSVGDGPPVDAPPPAGTAELGATVGDEHLEPEDPSPVMRLTAESRVTVIDHLLYPVRARGFAVWLVLGGVIAGLMAWLWLSLDPWGGFEEGTGQTLTLVSAPVAYLWAWVYCAIVRSGARGELTLSYLPSPLAILDRGRDLMIVILGSLIGTAFELAIAFFFTPLIAQGGLGIALVLLVIRFIANCLSLLAMSSAAIYDRPFLALRIDHHLTAFFNVIGGFFVLFGAVVVLVLGGSLVLGPTVGLLASAGSLDATMPALMALVGFLLSYVTIFMAFFLAVLFRRYKADMDRIYIDHIDLEVRV
ncbi:MAG: hypothetical protein AAGC60_19210 [Acidobacteriota bacterium]